MPISYRVLDEGHFIHAVAKTPLTKEEFIEYEIAHAIDERIKPPVSELFEISAEALKNITMDDMKEVLKYRDTMDRPSQPHRCAITLLSLNDHSWELAKFYEGMAMLHAPESVIVFANVENAKQWIGFEDIDPDKPYED